MSPPPRPRHQIILTNLCAAVLSLHETGRAVVMQSPIGVRLTERDIVQPDLIAVANENERLIGDLRIEGAPELVVEVTSPSSRRLDRGDKRALYESSGVLEYWILDPEDDTLTQHTLTGAHYAEKLHTAGKDTSTAFPELTVDLATIFAK